jgi:hypothetical protein
MQDKGSQAGTLEYKEGTILGWEDPGWILVVLVVLLVVCSTINRGKLHGNLGIT